MRRKLQWISWLALVTTILPPMLFLGGWLTLDQSKSSMLLGTIAWFVVTPCWMGREPVTEHEQTEI